MPLSIAQLAQARERCAELLEELGLEAYLYEIEPREGLWELRIDCALTRPGTWESTSLPVAAEALLAASEGSAARQQLLSEWRRHLSACKQNAAAQSKD